MRWASLLCIVVLTGCSSSKSKRVASPPPLPKIDVIKYRVSAAAVTLPPKPRTITLEWDKGEPLAITEVWSGPTPWDTHINLKAEVEGNRVTLFCDQPSEFYSIRNRLGEQYSEWGN